MSRAPAARALCLLCLAGCAGQATQSPGVSPGGKTAVPSWGVGEDELSVVMRGIAPELARAGVHPQESGFRGFLSTGARTTRRLQVPADTCATLVAIASRGVYDMDAALYSPQGTLLAADAQPDPRPTIQLCTASQPGEFYYALHVYQGAGSFLMVPFFGDKHSLQAVSRRLGTRPVMAHLDHGGSDPIDRLTAFSEAVRRRGFETEQPAFRMPLGSDQRIRVVLPVQPGRCYTAAGFAAEGEVDVDLRVLDDEGGEVARDEGPGDAALQFCAVQRAQFAAEVRGDGASGAALLSVYSTDSASLGGPDALWLGERPTHRPSQTPLDEALADAARRAAQDGFGRRRSFSSRHLLPGQAVRETIDLPARRCTRIHAVGGRGLRALRLSASDEAGQPLERAAGGAHSTYLHICSSSAQVVRLSVHAAAGSGEVAVVGFDAPLARSSVSGAGERLSARYHQAAAQAHDAGYRPHPAFEKGPRRVTVARNSQPLAFEAGAAHCVRALVLSPDPSVQAKLLRGGKPLLSTSANAAPAHACGEDETPLGHVDLALEASQGASDAWLMLLIK